LTGSHQLVKGRTWRSPQRARNLSPRPVSHLDELLRARPIRRTRSELQIVSQEHITNLVRIGHGAQLLGTYRTILAAESAHRQYWHSGVNDDRRREPCIRGSQQELRAMGLLLQESEEPRVVGGHTVPG